MGPRIAKPLPPQPLIPENYLDVPSQRLYYLSVGFLCQAVKVIDFTWSLASGDRGFGMCKKWLLVDLAYCAVLSQLRIPRLSYSKAVVLLQIVLLWFLDGMMFGAISFNIGQEVDQSVASSGYSNIHDLTATPESYKLTQLLDTMSFGLFSDRSLGTGDGHLLGQHTVRMSPISTAKVNPDGLAFCLAPHMDSVLIPILLNNTNISGLQYSLTPLGHTNDSRHSKVEYVELAAKDLKAIEQTRLESIQSSTSAARDSEEYDEYDEDDVHEQQQARFALQTTQSLIHVRLAKSGVFRLERIFDTSNIDARLAYPSEVTVVPCPGVEFVQDDAPDEDIRCAGQDNDVQLMIDIHGVPPLSIRWSQIINGRRENFLVEGIEGDDGDDFRLEHSNARTSSEAVRESGRAKIMGRIPQELRIPLTVSLDTTGSYLYALQEVVDGVGNTVRVGFETTEVRTTNTTRTLQVLRRPTVSFKNCGPGASTSLLIGSEAPLSISINEADNLDSPWEVQLRYQPHVTVDESIPDNKRYKPWKKSLETLGNRRELSVRASAPGDYALVGIQGKWCSGDVLAPEACRVIEKPLPSADIEWKRIHECSGDTGVSAALVLRGTPPFQVYYRVQRDNEPPREYSQPFANSRGELTIQPERSGHYIFTFVHMSDANYKKVDLKGPSIDQLIHPLAAADFANSQTGSRRNKLTVSSCEGSMVDVDVELRGTGPWNLWVQVVGPKSSGTLQITGIETSRKTLQVPIPDIINKEGGTFEIDIVSVEDAYKCKRPISVPGVSVQVRRAKPSVKFYGNDDKRRITVLERESASLPLRLTGDGPWHIDYRRVEAPDIIFKKTLTTPNDHILVTEKGLYEIVNIADSHCPGSVVADASTYQVDWTPRPFAKLSPQTEAAYDSSNGSHILPPICEGTTDYVDLDLTGRPPFQIMYNIAQSNDAGGTKLLDQPTFNSIQPRTRFQLQSSPPGRMYYEVKQIGDAAYPLQKSSSLKIPRSERLLFEQQVSVRPIAQFKNRNRLSYCLNDVFTPLDLSSTDGIVVFDGAPPFTLQISIKDMAASQTDLMTIRTSDSTWKVDLPSYSFKSIGPHLITIESVHDASNCAQATLDPLLRSVWVDVAETASIIPFDRREHLCVDDISQFQLEGIPPWTIGYRINGKSYTQESKVSPFSISQQHPGEFTITSISHQQKKCRAAVTDLRFFVHPLPSAQVGHGKRIHQDIHEGDQAEIVFTLIGEPPFTFTYQRTELSPRKGGKPKKVLETHTVSRVLTKEYSIYSALEGTWTVTSISDRHCRYPPADVA